MTIAFYDRDSRMTFKGLQAADIVAAFDLGTPSDPDVQGLEGWHDPSGTGREEMFYGHLFGGTLHICRVQ